MPVLQIPGFCLLVCSMFVSFHTWYRKSATLIPSCISNKRRGYAHSSPPAVYFLNDIIKQHKFVPSCSHEAESAAAGVSGRPAVVVLRDIARRQESEDVTGMWLTADEQLVSRQSPAVVDSVMTTQVSQLLMDQNDDDMPDL